MPAADQNLRDLLVALNATLPARPVVCRLGATVERWAAGGASARLAEELGVPRQWLVDARGLLPEAATLAAREREAAERHGAVVLTRLDAGFPAALAALSLPPPVLYCRGTVPEGPAVAIVGSRHPDVYGREAARFFAEQLAHAGIVVVSGFARGVDAAAHQGALATPRGLTVAVLGCGIDIDYPSGQRSLADRIAERGAVLSEFPLATDPKPLNFPVRNRLLAALAGATLVVQATPRSGSLITARLALDLGREVFALPGRIFDERSLGPNALLRDGARLALHPADLVAEVAPEQAAGTGAEEAPPLSGLPARVWEALGPGRARGPEELAQLTGASLDTVLAALLELELAGWAERFPGPVYCRRRAGM